MKQYIQPHAPLEILTRGELGEELDRSIQESQMSVLRGVSYPEVTGTGTGSPQLTISGPESGYVWEVRLLSFQVGASSPVSVYKSETNNTAPVAQAFSVASGTNNEVILYIPSRTIILKDQRTMLAVAGSANILNYRMQVKQVPAEMIGKLG